MGLSCVKLHIFITELLPLTEVSILLLLNFFRMNGWNITNFCLHLDIDKIWVGIVLTNSLINVGILTCCNTSLDFVNISESVTSGRLFLSYNGLGQGHLCHIDTFLVFV